MKHLLALLILLSIGALSLFGQSDLYTGVAPAKDPEAFDKAVDYALSKALMSNEIVAYTQVKLIGPSELEELLETYSYGYIEHYEVTEIQEENGSLKVTVRAKVRSIDEDILEFFNSKEFSDQFGRPKIYLKTESDLDGGKHRLWLENYLASRLANHNLEIHSGVDTAETGIILHTSLTGDRGDDITTYGISHRNYDLQISIKALAIAMDSNRIVASLSRDMSKILVSENTDRGASAIATKTLIEESKKFGHVDLVESLLKRIALRQIWERNFGTPIEVRLIDGSFDDADLLKKKIKQAEPTKVYGANIFITENSGTVVRFLGDPGLSESIPVIVASQQFEIVGKTKHAITVQVRPFEPLTVDPPKPSAPSDPQEAEKNVFTKALIILPIVVVMLVALVCLIRQFR